jgi:hypothetical protein
MSDAFLTKSVIHRLKSATYETVLGGESYRQHEALAVLTMSEAYACPNCKAVIFRWHK